MAEVKVGKKKFEVKPINLTERAELNDLIIKNVESPSFTFLVDVIKRTTKLTDEEINELSTDDIMILTEQCVSVVNKKK